MIFKNDMYSFKRLQTGFFRNTYGIYFEDTQIRTFDGSMEDLVSIVFLLNTAYMLGYNSGELAEKFDKKRETNV